MQLQPSEDNPSKLTNWENEPTLLVLAGDLEAAKPSHDLQVGKIGNWNDLMAVKGAARPKKIKGRSSVQPKLIRRQAEWRYSALTEPFLGDDKLFMIKPTAAGDGQRAKQNEMLLNWQFLTKINRVKFIDDYVRANVDEGTVIVRTGWKRTTVEVTEDAPVYTHYAITSEEQLGPLQQALELMTSDPQAYAETIPPELQEAVKYFEETGEATIAVQTGTEKVKVQKVLQNHPTVEVKNPHNIFIDPSCGGDLDKAMFVIESFETSYAELVKDKRYKNLKQIDFEGNNPLSVPDHETTTPLDFQFKDKARKKVVAFEYWGFYDINNDGILVPIVATWIGKTLIRLEENPYPDEKVPYVVVPYLPIKRELYGEPDAELLEDNQKILGAVTRGMIDLLGRSANGQQGFAKGMLDPLNRRRFENGQDYEFNPNVNPQVGLIEHKYPELPQSALLMLNLQNQEAEALTGVKSFAGGMSGESYGDVAAGIRGVLDAASKREMAILRRLAWGMEQIGNKIVAMNAVFLSEEEVIRVTNEEFVTVKREDLAGNYDLKVDISTAEVDAAKANDLAFMLQTMGNNLDVSLTLMILAEIAELKRMPELAKKLKSWQPQPDPIAQEIKQLELEKLKMEVEEMRTKAMLNQAKAEQAMAEKDAQDLDFIERESGVSHAREIEKTQAQARGNQNLQITKALTSPVKEGESPPDIEAAVGFNELSEGLGQFNQGPAVDIQPQTEEMLV